MAKRGRPRVVKPPRPEAITRMERSAQGIAEQEDNIKAHVQFLVQTLVASAKEAQTPPGIAVMAGCEFIALMLHFNLPNEQHTDELSRLLTYIKDRLKELNDVTTH